MKVLVDTSVWSIALRRTTINEEQQHHRKKLEELIRKGLVVMIGPVRQELLSGVKSEVQFDALRKHLAYFDDITLNREDYEQAARFFNVCRRKGIQGSLVDFLITAVAHRHDLHIYTLDQDFSHYQTCLDLKLLP